MNLELKTYWGVTLFAFIMTFAMGLMKGVTLSTFLLTFVFVVGTFTLLAFIAITSERFFSDRWDD